MQIKYRGLNEREIYCCSKKALKCVFGDLDVNAYFGYNLSRLESKNNVYYRPYKNCKDTVVAVMKINLNSIYFNKGALLNFMILNANNFDDTLRNKFEEEVLPKLYDLYKEYIDSAKYCTFTIGFSDGNFNLYSQIE